MGIISLASSNSCWRGLDYYKNKKINVDSIIISQDGKVNIKFK